MEEQGSHPGITNENKQFEHDAERAWCDMQTILEDQLPEKTVEQPESDMLMMHCLHAMCIDSNPQQGEIQPFDAGDDVAEAINELEPVCIESGRKLFLCPYKDCDKVRFNLRAKVEMVC